MTKDLKNSNFFWESRRRALQRRGDGRGTCATARSPRLDLPYSHAMGAHMPASVSEESFLTCGVLWPRWQELDTSHREHTTWVVGPCVSGYWGLEDYPPRGTGTGTAPAFCFDLWEPACRSHASVICSAKWKSTCTTTMVDKLAHVGVA